MASGEHMPSLPEQCVINSARLSGCFEPPSPIITKRTRTKSVTERSLECPVKHGVVRWFCRQKGHGFIKPDEGGDDVFLHISDIDGEFVPHENDIISYRTTLIPPKMEKLQAVHVTIKNLAEGKHERWDQPMSPHQHPHPEPNIHLTGSLPTR